MFRFQEVVFIAQEYISNSVNHCAADLFILFSFTMDLISTLDEIIFTAAALEQCNFIIYKFVISFLYLNLAGALE